MDTLFRLVSLQSSDQHQQQHQQQHSSNSFNSSTRTSSSSRSSSKNHQYHHQPQVVYNNSYPNYYYQYHHYQHQNPSSSNYLVSSSQEEVDQEECYNHPHPYMDEDHFSSSSNPHPNPDPGSRYNINPSSSSTTPAALDFSVPRDLDLSASSTSDLLLECARSVASGDTGRVQQLMWMLNELTSPYGDVDQKVASYFLQALFSRVTSSGPRTLRTLSSASDRSASFDSTRRVALKFQELSPWSSFGHVAANGAILESFLDTSSPPPQQLHIIDLSNTFCTQWPTLLEALATRSADDTPHLTITTVVPSPSHRVMKEIGARMEKFARLMGVPFKFNIVHHSGDLHSIDLEQLNLETGDAALAVNCVNTLHSITTSGRRRDSFISAVARLRPRIVTVVEEEADLDVGNMDEDEGFVKGFRESLRFFSAYFNSLEESFPKTSNERLALERAAGRAVVDLVGCPAEESTERRETASGWSRRMRSAGMAPVNFSDDVADDVRALLRRYKEGWSMSAAAGDVGVYLAWKEQPVVWASAWRM